MITDNKTQKLKFLFLFHEFQGENNQKITSI